MKDPNMLFITRVDQGHTHCWVMRISNYGEVVHKESFPDKRYGSKEDALEVAIIERDEWLENLSINIEDYQSTCRIRPYRYVLKNPNKRNSTGTNGVSVNQKTTKAGEVYNAYSACIFIEKFKPRRKEFSGNKYGDEKAFTLAVNQRKAWEKELLEKQGGKKI